MYRTKRVLAITFARAGSKGVPGKNLRHIGGRPLIAHTIESALASRYIDRIVMTTDGPEIARVAAEYGAEVPFMRPERLARDESPALPALKHAARWVAEEDAWEFDAVVTLEPTCPMRPEGILDSAIELFFQADADVVLGVKPVKETPCWMFTIGDDGSLEPLMDCESDKTVSRQTLPPVYSASGTVFVNRAEHFLSPSGPDAVPLWELGERVLPFVVHDPLAAIDLDTEADFAMLELLLEREAARLPG